MERVSTQDKKKDETEKSLESQQGPTAAKKISLYYLFFVWLLEKEG